MLNGIDNIEGLTPEQIEAINKLAEPVVNKKDELLEKLTKTKQQINDDVSAAEKLKALEASLERKELESKQNYQDALTLQESEFSAKLEKLTNSESEKDNLIHKLLVENGLNAELVALNVNKDLLPMIQQGLSAMASVSEGQAMIGDKSLSEYCKEWAETPAGKAACLAQSNSGTGSNGGSNYAESKKMADMTGDERIALFRENPAEFNRLKAEMQA